MSAKLSGAGRRAYIPNPGRQDTAAKTEFVTSMIERARRAWSGCCRGVKFAGGPGRRQGVAPQARREAGAGGRLKLEGPKSMTDQHFFNLDDMSQGIKRQLAEGLETRIFPGENLMLSVLRIGPNKSGEIHEHPQEQWGVMLEGSGTRIQDGVEHAVGAGDFWQTPGNVPHGFKAGPEGAVVLDIFSPPREEYRRAGSGFR